jgi:hypothetical protein
LALSRFDEKSLSGLVSTKGQWVLSHYDEKSLSNKKPTVTEIKPEEGMICGILEANDVSIWFGASDGVYRYDGSTIPALTVKRVKNNMNLLSIGDRIQLSEHRN